MATPRLKQGYLKIGPQKVKGKEDKASTIAGAFQYGTKLSNLPKQDLIVTGCVAVERRGWRLGKGGGYGDREITRLIQEFGKIPVLTTVHKLQIVNKVPYGDLDTKVDYIVTPRKVIKCKKYKNNLRNSTS